jgi:hypothetical protein
MAKLFGVEQNNIQPRRPALGIHVRRLYSVLSGQYDPQSSEDPETGKVKLFRSGKDAVSLDEDFLFRDPLDSTVFPEQDLDFLNRTLFLDSGGELLGLGTDLPSFETSIFDTGHVPRYTIRDEYLRLLINGATTENSGIVFHNSGNDSVYWLRQDTGELQWIYDDSSSGNSPDNGTVLMLLDDDGNLEVEGDVVAVKSSDVRLKKSFSPIPEATSKLDRLEGFEFTWKQEVGGSRAGKKEYGVLAHQVADVLPHAVRKRDDDMWAVDYDAIGPFLIQVCKEQQQRIEDLEAKVEALENG